MIGLRAKKNELRAHYRALRDAIPVEERVRRDEAIRNNILSLTCFRFAQTLLLYAPIGSEIDVMPLAVAARERGIRVAYPRCAEEDGIMDFYYAGSEAELAVGKFGIREPGVSAVPVTDFNRSILIVPGLVYDKSGHRLGYGRGYYDRFISVHPSTAVGVVYSDFIVDALPRGQFDLPVSVIVGDRGITIIS